MAIIRCERCGLEIMTRPEERTKRCPRCGYVQAVSEYAGYPTREASPVRENDYSEPRRQSAPGKNRKLLKIIVPLVLVAVIAAGAAVIVSRQKSAPPAAYPAATPYNAQETAPAAAPEYYPDPDPAYQPDAQPDNQPADTSGAAPEAPETFPELSVDAAYLSVMDIFPYGSYEQDAVELNGPETIEWLVLDKQEGRMLLVSRFPLEAAAYNETQQDATWENCTLRSFLNGQFYNKVFTEEEKAAILLTELPADPNPQYYTDPGNPTNDRVFLLSYDEVRRYIGGGDQYYIRPTVYLARKNPEWGYETVWWLRTPGEDSAHALAIYDPGQDFNEFCKGIDVTDARLSIRPAIWVRTMA